MIRRFHLLAILALAPTTSTAGGDAVAVVVSAMSQDSSEVRLRLALQRPGDFRVFGRCAEVSIAARHEPGKLRKLPWHQPQVTSMHHREALALLDRAHSSGEIIHFGSMGSGLSRGEQPCSFVSRGLRILDEEPGISSVLSFFDPV